MSTPRKPMSYLLRAVLINALLIVSIIEVQRSGGTFTGKVIAMYIAMAVLANGLMYFGARARRRMIER